MELINKTQKANHKANHKINHKTSRTPINNMICYTGIGSNNKHPNYTKTTFKKLANKTFKRACVEYHAAKKCNMCKKSKKKSCTLQKYMEYSGASYGKCE